MNKIYGYIHTYDEALLLVHALRLNLIKPQINRLTEYERNLIKSGDIFIFRESESMINRWTDGILWSPSKILGSFLLYKKIGTRKKLYFKNQNFISHDGFQSDNISENEKVIQLKENLSDNLSTSNFVFKTSLLNPKKKIRKQSIPLDLQFQNDQFIMHKKTIKITYNKENYHIISYFQPIFDKRSLSEIPFFNSLNIALKNHPELKMEKIDIKKYHLLEFNEKTKMAKINRKELLENAALILANKFYL